MPSAPEGVHTRRTALALVGALAATACTQVAFLAANLPAAFGHYRRRADLAYGSDPQQRLDVYQPLAAGGRPPTAGRDLPPLVVFWHGGRWTIGDKREYRFVGAALTEIGCVAVLPNYRHYPQVQMAGFMDDAAAALHFAFDHAADFGADPHRLYVMGHSSGAHLAALLALDRRYLARSGKPPPIAGLIGLSGPYDFLPLEEADLEAMFGPPSHYPQSQPINFVHSGAPPALLVHGLEDQTVWPKNSRNLATALAACAVRVRLELYPHLKHADTVAALSLPARHRAPTLAQIAEFVGPSDPQAA